MAKIKDKNKVEEETKKSYISSEEPYIMTAQKLFDISKARPIIPCTLSIDIPMGGGIPLGATVLIGGREKMGKTSMCLTYAANAQKLYNCDVFIFTPEGRLTHKVLDQIKGLNRDKAKVIFPPPIFNKNDELVGYKKWHAQQWWDAIGNTILKNPKSVIIVDSLAALSSEKEISESMGFQGRGELQKLESQFCRIYADMVIASQVTLFLITQLQANTSGYGSPFQMKVGNSFKFQSDVTLFGKSVEKWPEENGRVYGHNMIYRVDANALGPADFILNVPLKFGYGIDDLKDIVIYGINYEIIKREGTWYTFPYIEKDGQIKYISLEDMGKEDKPLKFQGENKARNWLLIHPKEAQELDKMIRTKAGLI